MCFLEDIDAMGFINRRGSKLRKLIGLYFKFNKEVSMESIKILPDAEYREGKLLTALFRSYTDAEKAYEAALTKGYKAEDISVFLSEEARNKAISLNNNSNLADKASSDIAQGMGVGGAIGTATGALLGAIMAIGTTLTLPGLGWVISGPLAAAVVGAGAGGITGNVLGGLIKAGLPEQQATEYEQGLKAGGIVLAVRADSDQEYDVLKNEWSQYQ